MGFVRRRARRRTALVVGGAAYAAGRHRSRQQDQDYEDGGSDQAYNEPPPAAPAPTQPSGAIDYDELKQLGELHANGTLTDEEFAAAKAKILGT
jgi:Short C-terminal domain